jgi:hypothetical protein
MGETDPSGLGTSLLAPAGVRNVGLMLQHLETPVLEFRRGPHAGFDTSSVRSPDATGGRSENTLRHQ